MKREKAIEVVFVVLRQLESELNAAAILRVREGRPPAFETALACERNASVWRTYQPGRGGRFSLGNIPPELAPLFAKEVWMYTLVHVSGPADLVVGDLLQTSSGE